MKSFFTIFIFLILTSCSNIQFVYSDKKNNINPLFENTNVVASGVDIISINYLIPKFFGKNIGEKYKLLIEIDEKKIKRSVETNQTVSNLNYELRFNYTLILKQKECIIYNKEILSNFSITPKSSGYNYGSDTSLEKKYELAVSDNFNQFISFITELDFNTCK